MIIISLSLNFKEQQFKKLQELENLLNASRRDAEEATNQHLKTLWSTQKFTQKELKSVWKAVNATQSSLEEKLMEVLYNFTAQVFFLYLPSKARYFCKGRVALHWTKQFSSRCFTLPFTLLSKVRRDIQLFESRLTANLGE